MTALVDVCVLTRSPSRFEPAQVDRDLVADYCDLSAIKPTSGVYPYIDARYGSTGRIACYVYTTNVSKEELVYDFTYEVVGWDRVDGLMTCGNMISPRTRATSVSATTVSMLGDTLRRRRRDERLKCLSPERRAAYGRIRKLREEIGPVDFDIVDTLRGLRANG